MASHYFHPAHMTKSSFGNVKACCDRPEAEHPAFVNGKTVTIKLTHKVTNYHRTIPVGAVVQAELRSHSGLAEVRPSRWGSIPDGPYKGTFAELDKGEYASVETPGYTINMGTPSNPYLMSIPVKWGKEI